MVEAQRLSHRKGSGGLGLRLPLSVWYLESRPGPGKKQLAAPRSPSLPVLLRLPLCSALWPLAALALNWGSCLHTPLPLHQFSTTTSPSWKSFLRSTTSLSC